MTEYPLSYQQQAMWFLTQTAHWEDQCAFDLCYRVRVAGVIDAEKLRAAIDRLVERHAVIGAGIVFENGQLWHRQASAVSLAVFDLPNTAAARSSAEDRAAAEARRAFQIDGGPLAAFTLIRFAGNESWVLLNVHHLIADGTSIHILRRDLAALYSEEDLGVPANLTQSGYGYADFVELQRRRLEGGDLKVCEQFWRATLPANATPLEFPLDGARPAVRSYRGAIHSVTLDRSLVRLCGRLSVRRQVPVSSCLLAAYVALLSRVTGERRVLIGTSFAGRREHPSFRHCAGLFINTVPLYCDLTQVETWEALIQHVSRVFASAYDHQEYPLQLLIEKHGAKRDLRKPALFQTAFNYQAAAPESPKWGACDELEFERVFSPTIIFDLVLHVMAPGDHITLRFDYCTDLYSPRSVKKLAEDYVDSLEQMISAIVSPSIRSRLLPPHSVREYPVGELDE